MTVWDYLDKHEIIGTFLACWAIFFGACAASDGFGAVGKLFSRRPAQPSSEEP